MSIADPKTPEEKREHDRLIEKAKKHQEAERKREKRRRENAELNSDEAIRRRNDFDVCTGE